MFKKLQGLFLHKTITWFLLWLGTILVFLGFQYYLLDISKKENVITSVQSLLQNELEYLQKESQKTALIFKNHPDHFWTTLDNKYPKTEKFILVFKNDSLIYWNNNHFSSDISHLQIKSDQAIENQTGWYLLKYHNYGKYRIYLSTLLKNKASNLEFSESPLLNGFWLNYNHLDFTNDSTSSEFNITSEDGEFIVGIKYYNDEIISENAKCTLFIIYLLGYIFLLLWILKLYEASFRIFKNKLLINIFFITDIIIIRIIEFKFIIPKLLTDSKIYENQLNVLNTFNSSGDLIINSILFLFVIFWMKKNLSGEIEQSKNSLFNQFFWNTIVWLVGLSLFVFIYNVVLQLPFNSFFGINVENANILLIFLSLLIILFSFALLAHTVFSLQLGLNSNRFFRFILPGISITIALTFIFHINTLFIVIITIYLVTLYLVYNILSKHQKHEFYKYLIITIILASVTAYTFNTARKEKKDLHQISTLQTLYNTNDKLLENAFYVFDNNINQDSVFLSILEKELSKNKLAIKEYINNTYFSDITEKYDVQITICLNEDMLELQPEGYVVNCSEYFENFIFEIDKIKITDNLFLIPERPESVYYFGKKFINRNGSGFNIFFEFYFTYVPEGLGYPELLISEAAMDIDLSGYCIARYKDNQLVNKFGEFSYLTNQDYMNAFSSDDLFDLLGFRHIKHKLTDDSYLIISRPNEKLAVQMVSFSILFIVFVTVIFIVSILIYGRQAADLLRISFQNRLQIIFVSAISVIIILLASIILFYINIDNQNRLTEQLTEKTNSVIVELQHKLSDVPDLYSIDPVELEMLLKKFSLVFFSDINLYSPSGELISTSRPEIFNRGLLSENINPDAFEELFIKNQLFYITLEKLGSITYYSSYAPLMLNADKPAGIINLPYFAKQSDVSRSYYQMIFTFINMFVILGIIGALLVLMLTRLITKPLVVLQKNLAEIQIDKQNEIIEWKGNDEIGQLINAYNQMIIKLEQSTELLKQSERESAWREVAQQIAHEIKNPLTPMKLNVQYLEKAFREKDPGLEEKVKNISEMLIAQIETLNKVAEMFSDFTKTKSRKFEKVNLTNVINKAIQLFKNHSGVVFIFKPEEGIDFNTKAYAKDVLRVFNNLIKNSIQSMDGPSTRIIEININTFEHEHVVEFIDNGKGISDEIRTNIFKPYFTTKSTGTGLGLAIVKNIMNEIGGDIILESTTDKGTCFVLKFQAYHV